MPYITKDFRKLVDLEVSTLIAKLSSDTGATNDYVDGICNYIITKLLVGLYGKKKYGYYNRAIGILECAKQEFYRRQVAPYEDRKIKENGDVYK